MTKNWEKEKDNMHELYMVRGMKLADMQKVMEEKYNFKASERAYKQKFKEWRWFKKTPSVQRSAGAYSDPDASSGGFDELDSPPRNATPIYTHRAPQHMGSGMQASGMNPYDPYGHATAYHQAPGSDSRGTPEPSPGYGMQHAVHISHTRNHTLAPIQDVTRGPLPPVSYLQLEAFKGNLREAEIQVELGQYDLAQCALETAMRSLQWLKTSG